MPEITPLGLLVILVIGVIVSLFIYNNYFYDENSQKPDYCNVYAQQYLGAHRGAGDGFGPNTINVRYVVNENIAKEACTEPHWDLICKDTPVSRGMSHCWVARSEPRFHIIGVK